MAGEEGVTVGLTGLAAPKTHHHPAATHWSVTTEESLLVQTPDVTVAEYANGEWAFVTKGSNVSA